MESCAASGIVQKIVVTPEKNDHGNDNGTEHNSKSNASSSKDNTKRPCLSLPLFGERSEVCTLVSGPGMECMPLRSPPGPYLYHVPDQAKSLQELQNEVGALLEFRDLVIETFPDLKNKMATSSASSTITGLPSSSSLASRREWEPGIRVRRKLPAKDPAEVSPSSLIRSRSNSHSGKKEPKSGEGSGSVVQDSGFSTETSSSKETHSASSTNGGVQGTLIVNANSSSHHHHHHHSPHRIAVDAEDELWNLLDVIHRKSNRLRDEVEHLQTLEKEKYRTNGGAPASSNFQTHLDKLNREDVQLLRKERDRLLDKLTEMEAETLSGRIQANKMHDQVETLTKVRKDLEDQLKMALSQKIELNNRVHDLHQQFVSKKSSSNSPPRLAPPTPAARKLSGSELHQHVHRPSGVGGLTTFSPVILTHNTNSNSNSNSNSSSSSSSSSSSVGTNSSSQKLSDTIVGGCDAGDGGVALSTLSSNGVTIKGEAVAAAATTLGKLDGLLSSPDRLDRLRTIDSKRIAAILLETNIVELQRHLLTLTVQNQVLQQRLDHAIKSKIDLNDKFDKARDDIEDLRFQLEEKNIELEGTCAQLRVIEARSSVGARTSSDFMAVTLAAQVSTPSMKAMVPLAMDEVLHHSSSTESAQDQTERDHPNSETPKRRAPSKIPLPGTKTTIAPKPPSGRTAANTQRSISGPPSNRSLNKTTAPKSGANGDKREQQLPLVSLSRPESAQSWRRDTSLGAGNNAKSSSIPVSSKFSVPLKPAPGSPLPKPKRDSLVQRARNLDSLSRVNGGSGGGGGVTVSGNGHTIMAVHHTSPANTPSPVATTTTTSLQKSNSKNNLLSASFTTGQTRDRKTATAVPVRRVSSGSVQSRTAATIADSSHTDPDSGKALWAIHVPATPSRAKLPSRELIKEYMSRLHEPPPILRPLFRTTTLLGCPQSPPPSQLEIAYKHPLLWADTEPDVQTSIIVPQPSDRCHAVRELSPDTSVRRLVGKLDPTLIRTWEELSTSQRTSSSSVGRSLSESSDKQSFVLFCRKPLNFAELESATAPRPGDTFFVNRMRYVDSSEDFFDSIDGQFKKFDEDNGDSDGDRCTTVLLSIEDSVDAGGEGMAEFDGDGDGGASTLSMESEK